MATWLSCKPCSHSDPAVDTVNIDPAMLAAGSKNQNPAEEEAAAIQKAEEERHAIEENLRLEKEELERAEAAAAAEAEEERRREEEERAEAWRRDEAEREATVQAEREEERRRKEEEDRLAEEMRQAERERAEREAQEALEKARKEEQLARAKAAVQPWLKSNGFSWLKASKTPIDPVRLRVPLPRSRAGLAGEMAILDMMDPATESTASSSGSRPSSMHSERARLRRLLLEPEAVPYNLVDMLAAKRLTALKWRADKSMFSALHLDGTPSGTEAAGQFQLPSAKTSPAKCIDLYSQHRVLRDLGRRRRPVLSDAAAVKTTDKADLSMLADLETQQWPHAAPEPNFSESRAFLLRFRTVVAAEEAQASDECDLLAAAPSTEATVTTSHRMRCGPPPPELKGLCTKHTPEMQMAMACHARSHRPAAAAAESWRQQAATERNANSDGATHASKCSPSEAATGVSVVQSSAAGATKTIGPPPGTFFPVQASTSRPSPPAIAAPFGRQLSLPTPSPNAFSTASMARQLSLPSNPQEEMKRTVKGLLNKICPETVDCIADKIASVQVSSPEELEIVIDLIFAKALAEPHYCETYADLVFKLKSVFPEFPSQQGGRPITFKAIVLNLCHLEFEGFPLSLNATEESPDVDEEEAAFQRKRKKDRMLANMKLTGHLFLRGLLPAKVIGSIVRELLLCEGGETEHDATPEEHAVECACELLMATGYTLEAMPSGKQALAQVCGRLSDLQTATTPSGATVLSRRVKFVVQDLLDTRAAGWTKKVLKTRPKTMSEIRLEQTNDFHNKSCDNTPGAEHVIAGQRPAYLSMPIGC